MDVGKIELREYPPVRSAPDLRPALVTLQPPQTLLEHQLAQALARIADLETALAEHIDRVDACEMKIEGLEELARFMDTERGYGV
jgi:hypothetical protein